MTDEPTANPTPVPVPALEQPQAALDGFKEVDETPTRLYAELRRIGSDDATSIEMACIQFERQLGVFASDLISLPPARAFVARHSPSRRASLMWKLRGSPDSSMAVHMGSISASA